MNFSQRIKEAIAEVPDFPLPGISFKDITPLLLDSRLVQELLDQMALNASSLQPDVIIGLESRGFILGPALAQRLGIAFIPLRKPGKLPRAVHSITYALEYGSTALELHQDDLPSGSRVLIHDDLLATGGTAQAATALLKRVDATLVGYDFIIELDYLQGRKNLEKGVPIHSMVRYS
ncbi:MAG: adenine phosphoribosyltransferase [Owenweeksia sp.]|nr:adenine phosphoribosyltransferase [Owenweeksia sp.]